MKTLPLNDPRGKRETFLGGGIKVIPIYVYSVLVHIEHDPWAHCTPDEK